MLLTISFLWILGSSRSLWVCWGGREQNYHFNMNRQTGYSPQQRTATTQRSLQNYTIIKTTYQNMFGDVRRFSKSFSSLLLFLPHWSVWVPPRLLRGSSSLSVIHWFYSRILLLVSQDLRFPGLDDHEKSPVQHFVFWALLTAIK